MNLFIKLLLCALVIAIAGPFFLKGPDGKPLVEMSELAPNVTGSFSEAKSRFGNTSSNLSSGKTKVYQWIDENGVMQISDTPPMSALLAEEAERRKAQALDHGETTAASLEGMEQAANLSAKAAIEVQEIVLNSNTNVIQSLSSHKIDKALGRNTSSSNKGKGKNLPEGEFSLGGAEELEGELSLTTIPLDKVGQLVKDATTAKALIENRGNSLDNALKAN